MTQQFQELLFNSNFDFKQNQILEFSVKPTDIHMSNAILYAYEYALFDTGDGYRRASLYNIPANKETVLRIMSIMETDTTSNIDNLQRELTIQENKDLEMWVVGTNLIKYEDFEKEMMKIAQSETNNKEISDDSNREDGN